jgi:steroid 5-alpha reductase family enzyme
MIDVQAWFFALAGIVAAIVPVWVLSVVRRDASVVDSLWSLLFLIALIVYLAASEAPGPRSWLVTALVAVWALRLSLYITVRNHGEPEDRRYQAIRANNQPHFWLKSLFIVFLLQGLLAWVICLPALAAVGGQTSPGPLDYAGVALWLVGMFFEVVGDYQLTRVRREEREPGAVLDTGLWRYTRHPNYFGEALLWWGIYLIACAAGAWWTIFAPLLMTFLLLRVSGVALLEKDIGERRPAYRDYVRRTNAFLPGPPRPALESGHNHGGTR